MTILDFDSLVEELKKQLEQPKQNWLFGAGISFNSNIPLMNPLTDRVEQLITDATDKEIYDLLKEELVADAHIEHYLSHIGDLIAITDRTKRKNTSIRGKTFTKEQLVQLHGNIIASIGDTVRYGYRKEGSDEKIGRSDAPIVKIEHHRKFVRAINYNRTNLSSRSNISFFTTNYDTLLEDALGLEGFVVKDGFSGGALANWNPSFEFNENLRTPKTHNIYKLHGSIDWQKDEENKLFRTRYGTTYLAKKSDIMIYPQATKYVETQKDPFAFLFSSFRNALNTKDENRLVICGYSFGDAHINAEIEAALSSQKNKTILIAFAKETPSAPIVINETIDAWLKNPEFGNRVYVAGENGIYNNSVEPVKPLGGSKLNWWTFEGLTNFLITGDYE